MDKEMIDKYIKPIGGCIKCAYCIHIRTAFFCGNKKLTDKQLYNDKGYCSKFVPKYGADMRGGKQE